MWCLRNSEFLWVCHLFKHRDKHPKSSNNKPNGLQEISRKWRKHLGFWFKAVHLMHQAWKHHASLIHQSCDKCHNHGNTMEVWLQAVYQACHKCCTSWKHNGNLTPRSSPNLSRMLHKLKKTCNSSTGANIPSPPNTPHASKQLLRERQVKKTERHIPEMEKNTGILIQSCPPNTPSMETPCKSDSPELRQMPQPWKQHGNLTPSSSPKLSQSVSQPVS